MKHTLIYLLLAPTLAMSAHTHLTLAPEARIAALRAPAKTDSVVSAYIKFDETRFDADMLADAGITITPIVKGIATARLPLSKLSELADTEGIEYVQTSATARQMLDVASAEVGATRVHAGTGLNQPYTGRGVVIGVVDAGFDYTHSAFRSPDGSLRIKRVWEQSATSGTPPEKFGYGIELATPESIEAAEGDVRNNSHGTHVAALAAGSDPFMDGAYLGMAPEAEIVLVSLGEGGENNVNISNAISYIYDYAESRQMPCVVNLSLGAHGGPHDGTSTFDVIADALQGPGRLIVGATGNHRADKFHVTHKFAGAADKPLRTFVDFGGTASAKHIGGTVEFWGTAGCDYEVAVVVYNTQRDEVAERIVVYPLVEGAATMSLGRNVSGDISAASEISPLNGKPTVTITNGIKSIRTNYAIAIEVTPKGAGQVDLWADNDKLHLSSLDKEGFTDPGDSPTVAEIGGTAKRILSVGAYTTRNEYTLLNETSVNTMPETVGQVCSFSGNGPTADGRMKPQISAPGCFIVSAVSQNDGSGTLLIARNNAANGRNNLYGYMQGTSMASPIVAGIVATWLQACPTLTPEQLEEVVAKTARHDAFTGNAAGCDYGHGKIDAIAGVAECISLGGAGISPTEIDKSIALDGHILTFLLPSRNTDVTIYDTTGAMVWQKKYVDVQPGLTAALPLRRLTRGIYILTVTADGKGAYTAKIRH